MTTSSGITPQPMTIGQNTHSWSARISGIAAVSALRQGVDDDRADGDDEARDPHPGEQVGEGLGGERIGEDAHRARSLARAVECRSYTI